MKQHDIALCVVSGLVELRTMLIKSRGTLYKMGVRKTWEITSTKSAG